MNSSGELQMIGDLTMHGTTREVTLDLDAPTAELTEQFRQPAERVFSVDSDQPEGFWRGLEP